MTGGRPGGAPRVAPGPAHSPGLSLAFSNLGHGLAHFTTLLFPTVVLALEHEWSLSYGELIGLMLLGQILFGAGALPAGWLADRWSTLGMMVICFIGMGAATLLTGFANGPLGLVAGLALTGLFASIYHPVGIAWLMRNAVQRGRAVGMNGVCGALGVALAPLLAGVLSETISWRAAFIVPGAATMAVGLALWLVWRRGLVRDGKVDLRPQAEPSRGEVRRAFFLLTISMASLGLAGNTIVLILPKLFAEGLSASAGGGLVGVGLLTGLAYILSAGTQMVSGRLADRYPLKATYLVAIVLFGATLFAAGLSSGALLVVAGFATAIGSSFASPAENVMLARFSPSKWRSTAFGVRSMLSLGASAACVPLIAFMHARFGGFTALLLTLGAVSVIAAGAALFLPGTAQPGAAPK